MPSVASLRCLNVLVNLNNELHMVTRHIYLFHDETEHSVPYRSRVGLNVADARSSTSSVYRVPLAQSIRCLGIHHWTNSSLHYCCVPVARPPLPSGQLRQGMCGNSLASDCCRQLWLYSLVSVMSFCGRGRIRFSPGRATTNSLVTR